MAWGRVPYFPYLADSTHSIVTIWRYLVSFARYSEKGEVRGKSIYKSTVSLFSTHDIDKIVCSVIVSNI